MYAASTLVFLACDDEPRRAPGLLDDDGEEEEAEVYMSPTRRRAPDPGKATRWPV